MENYRPITEWKEDDRPREKLLLKGRHSLSDAELLAILLGTGARFKADTGHIQTKSAVDLGKDILQAVDNNLINLARTTVADLMKIKGIGEAKAISILAALELGARRKGATIDRQKITCSKDCYEIAAPHLQDLTEEEFHAIFVNRANLVLAVKRMTVGGSTGTIMDPGPLFRDALAMNAKGIVLCHNHPSGSLRPSEEDIRITRKLKNAASFLDINIIDHVIISSQGYYSFGDQGMM